MSPSSDVAGYYVLNQILAKLVVGLHRLRPRDLYCEGA